MKLSGFRELAFAYSKAIEKHWQTFDLDVCRYDPALDEIRYGVNPMLIWHVSREGSDSLAIIEKAGKLADFWAVAEKWGFHK